ncbi:hypothetical protein ACFV6G_00540 [Streptomyces lavendulae]|uniref:hypothetical protein n=1 Tax=Streptomyces lavendulae TaxID=1914 RepID=UPI00368AF659
MHKIALTSKIWDLLDGTGVMQGEESPDIKAEMVALKHTKKGASGSVSLDTVGWLLDSLEALADGEDQAENQAVRAALAKLNPIYEENGGTWTTAGKLREQEESSVESAGAEDQDQDQGEEKDQGQDRDHAETDSASADGYGKPVYHEQTKAIVGYWAPGRFTPAIRG